MKVIRKVGIASGVVIAGTSAAACGAPADDVETTSASNLTSDTVAAGSGTFSLSSYDLTYQASNGGDEYVRTGESLTFSVMFSDVWEMLNPADYGCQNCPTDLSRVKVTVNLWFKKNGKDVGAVKLPIKWGTGTYAQTGATNATIIPPGVDQFYISYDAVDSQTGTTKTQQYSGNYDIPVYGGDLPEKNVIFDTNGTKLRQRTIEGGALTPGVDATLVYADWRADTVVNRIALNTQIGTQTSYSRFGTSIVALLGTVKYKIDVAISYDNGANWTTITLNEVDNTDQILPKLQYGTGRVGYEDKVLVPAHSTGIQLAFHLRAILVADYTTAYDVASRQYSQGQQITLADVWDNNGGKNYAIAVGQ